ncbi:MAG: SDR family NAD(P)-dependent oxidoreductase [Bacteroidales bacterium]|nr:SDR family NAD(P)-dependent oxidoreductase [Bacteroidales bacterium]
MSDRNYALITGASSGLGWHFSELLAEKGFQLIAVSNQPAELAALKKHLEMTYALPVHTVHMDLAREEAARSLYDYCEKNDLPVEVLVNNAGMLVYGEAASVQYAQVKAVLQLHMTTPALLCRLFSENMLKNGRGFILNVSSISAVMPYPIISYYGPTKTFLRHFTRALRTELKPAGVNVTCLLPGAIDTALFEKYLFDRELARRLHVLKHPEKVARAGIKALFRNRPECMPGLLNKLAIYMLPIIPQFIIGMIYARVRKVT